jgi:hypothetical protein
MSQRDVKTTKVDGTETTFLTPQEQAAKDARVAEETKLARSNPLQSFFRVHKTTTQDRP